MGTRKRKLQKQEEFKEEDDCFQMQLKIVNLLREKVHRLEDELNYLRSHQSLLYRAWSMPVYPPEYTPGSWIPPKVLPEQVSPQVEKEDISNGAGSDPELARKVKRTKTEKRPPAAAAPEKEHFSVGENRDSDLNPSSDSGEASSESDDEAGSHMVVETVTNESAKSDSSSSDDSSSDEEVEKGNSSESESKDESSSDSDDDKTQVTPAIGETKTQSKFLRVNWANEPRKRRAARTSSSSDSDSNNSENSVSVVEVADEEVISQPKPHEELQTNPAEHIANKNLEASEKNKKGVLKQTRRSAEKLGEVNSKKRGNLSRSALPSVKASTTLVEKLSPDATPEDIFDWNVLGLAGPWTQPKSSSFTHWHGSSGDSCQWPKQLASLPCRFGSYEEYISRNQWLVFEECKALLDGSSEIMLKRDRPAKDTSVGPDGMEDNIESRMFLLRSMHRCADDSFNYFEVEAVEGRRFQLDPSEVLLLSFPKFTDIKVLALVNSQGDKSVLLKTRVDLQSYGCQCKITRMSNMVTLKRQFQALVNFPKIWISLRQPLLDPVLNAGCTISPPSDDCLEENVLLPAGLSSTLLTWKEHGIFNNRQLLTMAALLQMKQGILLVQGPPGTGKTSTIVGMISALCLEEPGVKVLVCAASNAAVDEIVSRLMFTMLDKKGKSFTPKLGTIVRVGVQKSVQVACHPVTMDVILRKSSSGSRAAAKTGILSRASIICSTLSGSGHPVFNDIKQKFDVLVIDEAAQALECETLIALQRAKGRCVIVGDPCQLPATVLQRPGTAYGRSLFERMQGGGMKTFLLSTQYRMHPQISKYPSARFYHSCLRDSESTLRMQPIFSQDACDDGILCDGYRLRLGPYCFLDVSWGEEEIEATGHSLSNVEEAAVVATVVSGVVKSLKNGRKADIGVITPYLAQRSTIMTSLLKYKIDDSACEVNTVDGFQGREKDVIILSCVRAVTEKGLGFVSDEKRMNVALTRAKHALIIVGHGSTLKSQSASWKALLEDATSRGCYQVLRGGGANKCPGKSSLGEESVSGVSEKAAKFHSTQTSPAKKPESSSAKPSVLPAAVKAEPVACDVAHHVPGCGRNKKNSGQHGNRVNILKNTMRGAMGNKGPSRSRGGGKSKRGRPKPMNGRYPEPIRVAPPNEHIYLGPPPGQHQPVFLAPNPSYSMGHFIGTHEHFASFGGRGEGMNHGGRWLNSPGNVIQTRPFCNPHANRGRR